MMKKLFFFLVLLFFGMHFSKAQARFDHAYSIPAIVGGTTLLNPWTGGINFPLISEIDLDGDGRHDLFLFDRHNNRILTYLNNGDPSVNAWIYAPQYASQFPPINKWALFYDYNCDGKMDLMTLSSLYPSGIAVYRNDFTSGTGLQWTLVNPFLLEAYSTITTNIFASGVSLPFFGDIDGDGDMDILGYNSVPDGRIVYHQNLSMENYGNCDSLTFQYGTGCFGNFALLIGGTNSVSCFNCPCRTSGPDTLDPKDGQGNLEIAYDPSEAAKRDDTISSVFAIDLDGDGAKELLIGDISSLNTLMIHNGGTPTVANMDVQDVNYPVADVPAFFNGFHYHSYIDVDNDGKKDLIVLSGEYENLHGLWWYKNSGTNTSPSFHFQGNSFLQDKTIDVGESATPVPFDYDGDGLLDLVVGSSVYDNSTNGYKNSLYLYKNTGTATNPAFELITNDMANISALGYAPPLYPAFGDLDGDGDKDLVLGSNDGKLQYFNNAGGAGNPANFQLALPNYMSIDIGGVSTPQLIDLNRDGKLDMIVGEKNGFVNYFENSGTTTSASFPAVPTNDTLGCAILQVSPYPDGYTVPFAYDSLGKFRMIVSTMGGNAYLFSNIDNNLNGCFTMIDSLYAHRESGMIKFNLSVSGGDLNGDGLTDLVVGQGSGGVQIFYQHNPNSGVVEPLAIRPSCELFPNPATDQVKIRFYNLGNFSTSTLRILDELGKVVWSSSISSNEMVLETAEWADGIYLVQVMSDQGMVIRKLMVRNR